jgi:aryl-alcohol dehydrogenase-like predicted oxidoreductase
VIQEALGAGVNFIDTAEGYQTESIVGQAIEGLDRGSIVLSTKKGTRQRITSREVEASLEQSLENLGTDYIDLYSLHAVIPDHYEYLAADVVPTLQEMKDKGVIRHIGITEFFNRDTRHLMLGRALDDDLWDYVMVGFNIINQSARRVVLPRAMEAGVGTLIMFAVRLALSRGERLREVVAELVEAGELDSSEVDPDNPLGFLVHEGGAVSLPDAAYRFCRDEPGTGVVLSGTGNLEHLRANLRSFGRPPLPEEDLDRLRAMFHRVDCVTAQ